MNPIPVADLDLWIICVSTDQQWEQFKRDCLTSELARLRIEHGYITHCVLDGQSDRPLRQALAAAQGRPSGRVLLHGLGAEMEPRMLDVVWSMAENADVAAWQDEHLQVYPTDDATARPQSWMGSPLADAMNAPDPLIQMAWMFQDRQSGQARQVPVLDLVAKPALNEPVNRLFSQWAHEVLDEFGSDEAIDDAFGIDCGAIESPEPEQARADTPAKVQTGAKTKSPSSSIAEWLATFWEGLVITLVPLPTMPVAQGASSAASGTGRRNQPMAYSFYLKLPDNLDLELELSCQPWGTGRKYEVFIEIGWDAYEALTADQRALIEQLANFTLEVTVPGHTQIALPLQRWNPQNLRFEPPRQQKEDIEAMGSTTSLQASLRPTPPKDPA